MERFDIEARLSDVVAAAEHDGEVEVVRDGTVVARVVPETQLPQTKRRTAWFDPEAWRDVHEASAELGVTDATALVRTMRDEGG